MYCPSCGINDNNPNQFCRACGTDLRMIRRVLERPDEITTSAAAARDEIGRSIAAKIREMRQLDDLESFTENVLPEIEKFLESPAEKRLRRLRNAATMIAIGLSTSVGFGIAAIFESSLLVLAVFGFVALFIGIGMLLNGYFFSVTGGSVADTSPLRDAQRELETFPTVPGLSMSADAEKAAPPSVTEPTTRQLKR